MYDHKMPWKGYLQLPGKIEQRLHGPRHPTALPVQIWRLGS